MWAAFSGSPEDVIGQEIIQPKGAYQKFPLIKELTAHHSQGRFMRVLLLAYLITIVLLSSCASTQTTDKVSSQDYNQSQPGLEQLFIIPAVLMDGKKVGDLVLGRTTLKEALKIMPAWRGYPPKPPPKFREEDLKRLGKVGDVLGRTKLGYNPMMALYILFFDKNKKLVIVQRDFSDEKEKQEVRKIYDQHQHQLKEVYKESDFIRMQGEIQPCITLEVFLESGEPFRVGYIFTCPTK
jgi:hypothetical protein